MYNNLLEKLSELIVFTPVMVMQLTENRDRTVLQWLSRQEKRGKIIRIKRGKYMTRQHYLTHKSEPGFVASVAHIIEPNSYLSAEWVLQKFGVLSESVYKVTSKTTKHTKTVENEIGEFIFTQIKPELFSGYRKVWCGRSWGYEASKMKALFDYFYQRKTLQRLRDHGYSIRESERLNLDELSEKEISELERFARIARSPKMTMVVNNLKEQK